MAMGWGVGEGAGLPALLSLWSLTDTHPLGLHNALAIRHRLALPVASLTRCRTLDAWHRSLLWHWLNRCLSSYRRWLCSPGCPSLAPLPGVIGRASCRYRVCQYVEIAVVAVAF